MRRGAGNVHQDASGAVAVPRSPSLSLPKIGQLFGGRDHTTVMYANNKIGKLMTEKRSIYNQVTEISNRIKHNQRYKSA